jgi:predicted HicB family RNase H-like nuclease
MLETSYAHLMEKGVETINQDQLKRVNVRLEPGLHTAFKTAAAANGEIMSNLLLEFIQSYVAKHAPKALPKKKSGRA